ncbi:hypothetical protein EDB83DRAFT_2316346 [Lactarius deliciosus]|nr:hypothetical protein EDB83DRAFT_2316346 [Lactarius deliciosus]
MTGAKVLVESHTTAGILGRLGVLNRGEPGSKQPVIPCPMAKETEVCVNAFPPGGTALVPELPHQPFEADRAFRDDIDEGPIGAPFRCLFQGQAAYRDNAAYNYKLAQLRSLDPASQATQPVALNVIATALSDPTLLDFDALFALLQTFLSRRPDDLHTW